MSVRRGLMVLVIAGVAAALAAPAATAKTKVVVAGGPPPKPSVAAKALHALPARRGEPTLKPMARRNINTLEKAAPAGPYHFRR